MIKMTKHRDGQEGGSCQLIPSLSGEKWVWEAAPPATRQVILWPGPEQEVRYLAHLSHHCPL